MSGTSTPTATSRVDAALQRLAESRAGLRQVLIPDAATAADHGGTRWLPRRWRAIARAAAASASPWIREHPVGAIAAAAALGGMLVVLRPWRWTLAGDGLPSFGQQVLRWAGVLLSQPSSQLALASLLSSLAARAAHKPPAPDPGVTTGC